VHFFVCVGFETMIMWHARHGGFSFYCSTYKTRMMSATCHPSLFFVLKCLKPWQQATLIVMVFLLWCGLENQDEELWSLFWFLCVLQALKPWWWATFIFMVFFYYSSFKTRMTNVACCFGFFFCCKLWNHDNECHVHHCGFFYVAYKTKMKSAACRLGFF